MKIILIILLLVSVGCSKTNDKEESKDEIRYNTSESLKEEKEINGLKLEFISLEYIENVSTLKVRVINNTNEVISEKYVNIKYKNKEGSIVYTSLGYIKELSPSETTVLVVNDTVELNNVESVEYEVIE